MHEFNNGNHDLRLDLNLVGNGTPRHRHFFVEGPGDPGYGVGRKLKTAMITAVSHLFEASRNIGIVVGRGTDNRKVIS